MKKQIEPEYGEFYRLTAGRLFVIPDYQRHYSWLGRNREDMFCDILEVAAGRQDMHFMATIVCLDLADPVDIGTTRYNRIAVVDGQQRITTLVALLKAIEIRLASGGVVEKEEGAALRTWIIPDGGNNILLQTNHDGNTAYADYLRKGTLPNAKNFLTKADRNIHKLIVDVTEFVSDWETRSGGQPVTRLLSIIKNDITFLLQVLSEERSVYKIFEVLNSRGLPVDVLDKLKALLMGIGYDLVLGAHGDGLQIQLRQIWSEIYRAVGDGDIPGHEIVRFAATLHDPRISSRTISSEDALEYFSSWCRSDSDTAANKKRLLDVCAWVRDVARALSEIHKDDARRSVTRINQARLLAVAINLRSDVTKDKKDRWIDAWERATFRLYGMFGKDSRSAVGVYNRLAQDVWHKRVADRDVPKRIMDIVGDEKYSIENALSELRDNDCYTDWQPALRYMLFRIEQALAKSEGHEIDHALWTEIWQSRADDTIEHILPKDPSWWNAPEWKGAFSVRKYDSRLAKVHCIGNLTILPHSQNSKAGGKSFGDKKKIYKANPLFLHREILSLKQWTQKEIEDRQERILRIAAGVWGDL